MFDESKHPRDDRGRFTDGAPRHYTQNMSYAEILRQEREAARLSLDYFGSKKPIPAFDKDQVKRECPKEAYGFADRERLFTQHHQNHAKEMGYKNQQAYEIGAIDFWKRGIGKLYYSPTKDRYYRYNEVNQCFLSIDKDGVIHTYMLYSIKGFKEKMKGENLYEL